MGLEVVSERLGVGASWQPHCLAVAVPPDFMTRGANRELCPVGASCWKGDAQNKPSWSEGCEQQWQRYGL